jgi:hypothetical protein
MEHILKLFIYNSFGGYMPIKKKNILLKLLVVLFILFGSGKIFEAYVMRMQRLADQAIMQTAPEQLKNNLNRFIVNRRYKKQDTLQTTLLIEAIKQKPDDLTAHELIKILLAYPEVEVNLPEKIKQNGHWIVGRAPINWAVERGNKAAVKLLLEAHAEHNIVDPINNKTPLEFVKSETNKELREAWHLDEIQELLESIKR